MMPPETQYTKVDGSWLGYQVVGDGPVDLCFLPGMASNVETMWDFPAYSQMLERIASWSRFIVFDPRGSGVSDDLTSEGVHTWENLTQDVRAVLDAASSGRTAIMAQYDGGLTGILFAATYPDRTSSLVLWNSYARSMTDTDYPIGWTTEAMETMWSMYDTVWGRPEMIAVIDPTHKDDVNYCRAASRFMRTSSAPNRALANMQYTQQVDARSALASVRVPTLALHSHNSFIPVELGRYAAAHIAGARFVEVPSPDLNICALPEWDKIIDEIEEFVTGSRRAVAVDRVLATVLFTDIVGSTETASALGDRRWKEVLAGHDRIANEQVDRFKGRLVNRMGDGVLATFDGPGRAIRCAQALGLGLEQSGIKIRAGLHTGEIELRDEGDVGGIAVHIAARVMHEAGPGEVICSRTVKDLVAGSEFAFDDRGLCALKGVHDEWQLYSVRQA